MGENTQNPFGNHLKPTFYNRKKSTTKILSLVSSRVKGYDIKGLILFVSLITLVGHLANFTFVNTKFTTVSEMLSSIRTLGRASHLQFGVL